MIDAKVSYYTDKTVSLDEIQEFFKKSRSQALNKEFVSEAEEVILIAEDLFYYVNDYLPDSPEGVSPILLSVPNEENLFEEKTTFTGPKGIIIMILGQKPFNEPPYLWRSNVVKSVLPSHIVGEDEDFLYIDGEVATINFFSSLGILVFRAQSLLSSTIENEQFAKDLAKELLNTLEYTE